MLTKLHAYLGLVLLLPLFIWTVTGIIFLFRPGYSDAFAPLQIQTQPLQQAYSIPAGSSWQEVTYLRTALGRHLLITENSGEVVHLQAESMQPWTDPPIESIKQLLNESLQHDRNRYGTVETVEYDNNQYWATTTTEVQLTFDWSTLQLAQVGRDTRFINRLYRLHYLQWTPNPMVNIVLGVVGLLALLAMCVLSLRMLISVHKWE